MAFTFTGDMGCEFGGGVSCQWQYAGWTPKQSFIGYMLYNRTWFKKDQYAVTIGGGQINNPGPLPGSDSSHQRRVAASAAINSPYFTGNPGRSLSRPGTRRLHSITCRSQYITFRWEYDYRHASVPYWSGAGGITPPPGSNNGFPQYYACSSGASSGQTSLERRGNGLRRRTQQRLVPRSAPRRAFHRHGHPGQVLGSWSRAENDARGLDARCDLPWGDDFIFRDFARLRGFLRAGALRRI